MSDPRDDLPELTLRLPEPDVAVSGFADEWELDKHYPAWVLLSIRLSPEVVDDRGEGITVELSLDRATKLARDLELAIRTASVHRPLGDHDE